MKLNKLIDHTLLKATATKADIAKLCEEAIQHDFKSVCVNPVHVNYAKNLLMHSDVLVCTVVGFPLGATLKEVKAYETTMAIANGADEIDMVINIGAAKEHNYEAVYEDILAVVEAANGVLVKVIIETCYLTEDEKYEVCQCALRAKANFVKTSTGFGTGGATVEDIILMKSAVSNQLEIKASGGVKTPEDLDKMVENGATRIGTSSGIALILGKEGSNNY